MINAVHQLSWILNQRKLALNCPDCWGEWKLVFVETGRSCLALVMQGRDKTLTCSSTHRGNSEQWNAGRKVRESV